MQESLEGDPLLRVTCSLGHDSHDLMSGPRYLSNAHGAHWNKPGSQSAPSGHGSRGEKNTMIKHTCNIYLS